MVKAYRRRDAQFKFDVVIKMLTGQDTVEKLCAEYGVPRGTRYEWRTQLLGPGPQIFEAGASKREKAAEERIAELERMVGRLTMEVEVLKKASTLLSSHSAKDEA